MFIGGPSVADVTDFEKAPLGFGQNYVDPKKATPVCTVKVSLKCTDVLLNKLSYEREVTYAI